MRLAFATMLLALLVLLSTSTARAQDCDFEVDLCGWTASDFLHHDHVVAPHGPGTGANLSNGSAYSGVWPSACGAWDGTDANSCATLISPPFIPTALSTLSIWTWYEIEGQSGGRWWDRAAVHIIDAAVHTLITPASGRVYDATPNAFPSCGHLNNQPGWGGIGTSWVESVFALGPWAGRSIRIEIAYNTGSINGCEGLYVDEITVVGGCGDSQIDPGEDCDDGGIDSSTCDADCTPAACGDGTLNTAAGETCDTAGQSSTCDADCTPAACGDGTLNTAAGEMCDTGGQSSTCDADCTPATCGDGTLNTTAGETCDTGGQSSTCDADCTPATCGDGTLNTTAGETCDTAGQSSTCDADCTPATCGDGTLNTAAGEMCDTGGQSSTCDADCTPATCGDGTLNTAAGETCDTGGQSSTCDADCTPATCGDGTLNTAAGETCDTGGQSSTCDADCTPATCGDGYVNVAALEQCDDGPGNSNTTPDACRTTCVPARCGDGTVDTAEHCDDGNSTNGDGCSGCRVDVVLSVSFDRVLVTCVGRQIEIAWTVLAEDGTVGYGLERATSEMGPFRDVGIVAAATGSYSSYSVADPEAVRSGSDRWYRVVELCVSPPCSRSLAVQAACGHRGSSGRDRRSGR